MSATPDQPPCLNEDPNCTECSDCADAHGAERAKAPVDLVLVTGISGSGKSVALHALEDAGFYCVDNLPPELLLPFLRLERDRVGTQGEQGLRRIAIAVDVRSAQSLPQLLPVIQQLGNEGVLLRSVFLDAATDSLVRRYSETRRRHPLSQQVLPDDPLSSAPSERMPLDALGASNSQRALVEAIELERELLAGLREVSTVVDTSKLRPTQLRAWVRQLVQAPSGSLTLVFESFAFKNGVPLDADLVYDVRVLPNPHYERELKPLSGRDAPVAAFLEQQPDVRDMLDQIDAFLVRWLPSYEADHRAYLTVAIGCTGGQHRSVYLAEQLAQRFGARRTTLVRHRELDARSRRGER